MKWSKKRHRFTEREIEDAYRKKGTVAGAAKLLGVSYATASKMLSSPKFKTKRQGYNAPTLPISGNQCRHAREFLGLTRDEFCQLCGVGKTSLREFELGRKLMRKNNIGLVMALFDQYGISFAEDGTFYQTAD